MDILAWTIRAIPFVSDKSISETLNTYRAVEIPLQSSLLQRYNLALSNS